MGIFQDAVNNIKKEIAELQIDEYYSNKYAIKTCDIISKFKTFNGLRLELLFLDNTEYLTLTLSQNKKILSGNYKNLFIRFDDLEAIESLKLQGPIQVNNVTNIYNNNNTNDLWEEFAI